MTTPKKSTAKKTIHSNLGRSVEKGTMKGPARKEVWRPVFLDTLTKTGNILASCRAANVSRTAAYRAKRNNKEFSDLWDEAIANALDLLEARGFKLAMDGDGHMIRFLLAAHRPDTYQGSNLKRGTGQQQGADSQPMNRVVIYIPDNGRGDSDAPKASRPADTYAADPIPRPLLPEVTGEVIEQQPELGEIAEIGDELENPGDYND